MLKNQTPEPIKIITFDLDDTLWPIRPVIERAETKTYRWLTENAPQITDQFSQSDMLAFKLALMRKDSSLRHRISDMRRNGYRELALASGYTLGEASELAAQAFETFIELRQQVNCFAGVEAMLEELAKNYMLGALTNGNANLKKIPIGRHFDFSISAESVNASKPDQKIFNAALEQASLFNGSMVQPNEVVHVGDDLHTDVGGAMQAGFYTVWLRAKPDEMQNNLKYGGEETTTVATTITPHATIDTITALPKALSGIQYNQ